VTDTTGVGPTAKKEHTVAIRSVIDRLPPNAAPHRSDSARPCALGGSVEAHGRRKDRRVHVSPKTAMPPNDLATLRRIVDARLWGLMNTPLLHTAYGAKCDTFVNNRAAILPGRRVGTMGEVAQVILMLMINDYVTGEVVHVDESGRFLSH
jgi:hypothetical protein